MFEKESASNAGERPMGPGGPTNNEVSFDGRNIICFGCMRPMKREAMIFKFRFNAYVCSFNCGWRAENETRH